MRTGPSSQPSLFDSGSKGSEHNNVTSAFLSRYLNDSMQEIPCLSPRENTMGFLRVQHILSAGRVSVFLSRRNSPLSDRTVTCALPLLRTIASARRELTDWGNDGGVCSGDVQEQGRRFDRDSYELTGRSCGLV